MLPVKWEKSFPVATDHFTTLEFCFYQTKIDQTTKENNILHMLHPTSWEWAANPKTREHHTDFGEHKRPQTPESHTSTEF